MARKFRAYNFVQVTERIATSGVVPLDEFSAIAATGFRRVINLLPDDNQYAQAGEAETVQRLGMDYVHIPIDIERPRITDYDQFERAMDGAGNHPVWVHCAANWRVSAFVSLYAQARLGWSRQQGDELVRRIWEPTPPWLDLAHQVLKRESEGSS